jgi:hypothetical protein
MAASAERAEARILDHCASFGRWLEDASTHASASGRLCDELDDHTLDMLRHGLAAHPYRDRALLSARPTE